ncbi:MAG TPA: LON peptidase substrate-binding domain-containing protein [Acetobacteraceae bacterium]|nr:LON peptidase substrate-binding domain-containing protein [Acetobacteraceae bacterium]
MPAFHPAPGDLPTELAVFPLPGALLLPRGKLPLNIFETRYLAMTEDSLASGRMFGMIQPDSTAEALPTGPGLFNVGCLGRLSSFSETDDGRFLITLTGVIRFSIDSELEMRRGYRRIRADFSAYLGDLNLDPQPTGIEREILVAALRAYFARRNVDANWDAIRRMPDETLVVTLAMVCPFEPVEKQALLEAPDEAQRAATLLALLQMGAAAPDESPGRPVS